MALDVISGETRAEHTARVELLEKHPRWDIALEQTDHGRWWIIRDQAHILLARHRDIVIAAEVAERRRVL